MWLPKLLKTEKSENTTSVFGGYNHNLKIGEGEFYYTENITTDFYPTISPRASRGVYVSNVNPLGMIAKDGLCYVDGECIVIGGHKINLSLDTDKKRCPKRLISMGAYIIVFPDKKYVNTANFNDFGSLEQEYNSNGKKVRFILSRADGTNFEDVTASETEPTAPENMDLWLDTSGDVHVLKQYSDYSKTWVSITTTYVRIEAEGIGKGFSEGDGVLIEGIEEESVTGLNGNTILRSVGDNYIVVTGILKEIKETTESVSIKRYTPDMDFVLEHENRLWGCKYGLNSDGKFVNEIYACKLGDFKNWNCFEGISTDSYVVSVGSGGNFTGAISYGGYPLFFKEGCIHKILGYSPSSYHLNTTVCDGVEEGSAESLVVIQGVLYYKSPTAVCAYGGSLPEVISQKLGTVGYRRAVAGAYRSKYYISMQDVSKVKSWSEPVVAEGMLYISQVITAQREEKRLLFNAWENPKVSDGKMKLSHLYDKVNLYGIVLGIMKFEDLERARKQINGISVALDNTEEESWNLFVFDTEKGTWVREDNTRVDSFCSVGVDTYFIKHGDNAISTVYGKGKDLERVRFCVETGDIGTDVPNKKYISRLNVRLCLGLGSTIVFSAQYDSSGKWIHLFSMGGGDRLKSVDLPIKVMRCDHLKLKIEGAGQCKIYSITKTVEKGSRL